jgi:hypothetical protein
VMRRANSWVRLSESVSDLQAFPRFREGKSGRETTNEWPREGNIGWTAGRTSRTLHVFSFACTFVPCPPQLGPLGCMEKWLSAIRANGVSEVR